MSCCASLTARLGMAVTLRLKCALCSNFAGYGQFLRLSFLLQCEGYFQRVKTYNFHIFLRSFFVCESCRFAECFWRRSRQDQSDQSKWCALHRNLAWISKPAFFLRIISGSFQLLHCPFVLYSIRRILLMNRNIIELEIISVRWIFNLITSRKFENFSSSCSICKLWNTSSEAVPHI